MVRGRSPLTMEGRGGSSPNFCEDVWPTLCTNREVQSSVFRVAVVTIAIRPERKKFVS